VHEHHDVLDLVERAGAAAARRRGRRLLEDSPERQVAVAVPGLSGEG
jgi:hypothetical protein